MINQSEYNKTGSTALDEFDVRNVVVIGGLICSSNLIVNLAQERRAALAKRKNKEYINDIDDEMETIRKRTLATEHYYEIAFEITSSIAQPCALPYLAHERVLVREVAAIQLGRLARRVLDLDAHLEN
ncbi:hypothetical protein PRIPAC_94560 [Pristionchus pacificus]|uniref:Uncharacterized protein n=1 Tax=Pristionchus pacificus TaxID=54126 RepID=A0A2A6CEH2_PRIPA|nr:hypothetical protein PRIPAC_94560 [Pristionchus pacificus]|eukprot:PDM76453.1 hypothetical protein PRIPAC_40057 [Pristionchus pacificus]